MASISLTNITKFLNNYKEVAFAQWINQVRRPTIAKNYMQFSWGWDSFNKLQFAFQSIYNGAASSGPAYDAILYFSPKYQRYQVVFIRIFKETWINSTTYFNFLYGKRRKYYDPFLEVDAYEKSEEEQELNE